MQVRDIEKEIVTREDYIVAVEDENIKLREEIKKAKFMNERSGYDNFVNGLTQLRNRSSTRKVGGVPAVPNQHFEKSVVSPMNASITKESVNLKKETSFDVPTRLSVDATADVYKSVNSVKSPLAEKLE